MAQKIPPPPQFTGPEWQSFNRWLLEVTSVLSNTGGINPDQVTGLTALFVEVAVNTVDITALQASQSDQTSQIAFLQSEITQSQNDIITINGQITSLNARATSFNGVGVPAGGLGVIGDWYANVGGGVGARIYIKTAVATWTPFPF